MDPFDIFTPTYPDGRSTALAMRDMGIRAVIAPDGLRLISRDADNTSGRSPCVLGPKFQPKDELGRFVAYWVLPIEIGSDLIEIEEDYHHA